MVVALTVHPLADVLQAQAAADHELMEVPACSEVAMVVRHRKRVAPVGNLVAGWRWTHIASARAC